MQEKVNEKAARVLDLLEQIESVNEMIAAHEGDSFMQDQYIFRKEEFVKALGVQLSEFKIELSDLAA